MTDRIGLQRWPSKEGLAHWFERVVGLRIPARAVCPEHQAPMDVVYDLFSQEEDAVLIMANRSGGKTIDIAALHLANGAFKPGHETSHIGAIQPQAKRAYRYYRQGLKHEELRYLAPDPHIESTEWSNGSWIEILPGTEAQTQGGHPMLVAFDEVESGKRQPWENAQAMPKEWEDEWGRRHIGQFVATSTRVTSMGLMQHAVEQAEKGAATLYTWCIFETMEPCDGQEGRAPCAGEACPIWKWCGPCECGDGGNTAHPHGRAVHADGWRSLKDVLGFFRRVSIDTWEAQALCLKPEAKALIYANFGPANIDLEATYNPGGGPIFLAYDWGFTDKYHVALLQREDGEYFQFDEIVGNETSERDVVRATVRRITELDGYDGPDFVGWEKIWASHKWPRPWPKVWPEVAVGDPSAVQLRQEFKSHGVSAKAPRLVKHEVEAGQDVLRAAIATAGGLRRYRIHPRCSVTIDGFNNYRAKELADGSYSPRPDPDPANHRYSHACDAPRYLFWTHRRALGVTIEPGGDDDDEG